MWPLRAACLASHCIACILFVKIIIIIVLHSLFSSVFSSEPSQTAVVAAVVSCKRFNSGQYSSVGVVTSLRARPRNQISIPDRSNILFSETSGPTLVHPQPPVQGTWGLQMGG